MADDSTDEEELVRQVSEAQARIKFSVPATAASYPRKGKLGGSCAIESILPGPPWKERLNP